jgi:hypothetical protein
VTAPDDGAPVEEHINPATGYVETTAHEDGPGVPPAAAPVDEDAEDEVHINPATGFVETTAHDDRRG